MRTRHLFLPMDQVQPGMVLAEEANVVQGQYLSMTLATGHTLTEENISQLRSCQAQYVFIAQPDTRSNEQIAVVVSETARRTLELFAGADLSQPHMAAFFDQVLVYRST
ncbi:hypothetical protein [Rhodoferax sp.]|uniref:hypothetical protein n=1 Tax=Rhodoferax sp. TaxID=50421 RepID=UPI00260C2CB7|nr:hypothetical protein [Rhodoferax sp.]MDD2808610.1 hypothetical protein [Rhodoferax sp.]MDD4942097.1 hypothetical protein [Rhodoferax sp.]